MPFSSRRSKAPGNALGRGRPPGSRNKLSEDFLRDAHESWCEHGRAAFQKLATDEPAKFVALIASLMPKEFDLVSETTSRVQELSDEELNASIDYLLSVVRSEGGLPSAVEKQSEEIKHG